MKKIIFLIYFSFISCSSGLKFLNKFDGFDGKPKRIERTSYEVKNKDNISTLNMASRNIDFYDRKGRKTKTLMYKSDGSPSTGGTYYSYDKYGNLIRAIMYNRDSTVNMESRYKYDEYGKKIETDRINGFKKFTTKMKYNRESRTVKIIGTYKDGSFKENAILKFDDNWKKSELVSYDSIGVQTNRIEFFYDDNGNEIQSKWYNSKNELYNFYNKTYNSKKTQIRTENYRIINGEPKLTEETNIEYEYDKKGNPIEKRIIHNGETTFIIKFKYSYVW